MAHVGWLLVLAGAVAGGLAVLTGQRRALTAAAALLAAAAAVLAWALLTSDFTFAYVAAQSRRDASAWYRFAGLWGGPEGSLLTFTTFAALAAACTPALARRASDGADRAEGAAQASSILMPTVVRLVGLAVAVLAAVTALLADPFEQLALPAVDGGGLTPILEHPAMAVHPPLLYVGLVAALPAFALAAAGLLHGMPSWSAARRCLLVEVGALTLAMALGGLWSYVEAGWGGYWAWDPVENTSLAPWLAALVAIHLGRAGRPGAAGPLAMAPWFLVLAGAALTRSGATPSVHAFASSDRLGLGLSALAVATAAVAVAAIVTARRAPGLPLPDDADAPAPPAMVGGALFGAAAIVVLLGTATPVVRRGLGDPGTAVGGWFFADLIAPMALVAAVALGVAALRSRPRVLVGAGAAALLAAVLARTAGWPYASASLVAAGAFVVIGAVAGLVEARRPAWLAHLGLGLLLLGVGGTVATVERTLTVAPGATVQVAGVSAANRGVAVEDGPRPGTQAVVATVELTSRGRAHTVTPSLVAYPDAGGVLAETARWSGLTHDVQVVLVRADDDGRALLTLRVRPLVSLVWLGALAMAVGSVASLRARRRIVAPTPVTV